MKRYLLLLLLVAALCAPAVHFAMPQASAPAQAAPSIPDTPAGRRMASWLPVLNAGDEAKLRAVLPQLGLGLHALHGAGKIHRDIKPSNLLVTEQGRLVLLDFGLVADLQTAHRDPSFGTLAGTVGYMAPEQASGETKLTPAVDWYAVGVVMYQALTGRLPFTGSTLRISSNCSRGQKRNFSRARKAARSDGSGTNAGCAILPWRLETRPRRMTWLLR